MSVLAFPESDIFDFNRFCQRPSYGNLEVISYDYHGTALDTLFDGQLSSLADSKTQSLHGYLIAYGFHNHKLLPLLGLGQSQCFACQIATLQLFTFRLKLCRWSRLLGVCRRAAVRALIACATAFVLISSEFPYKSGRARKS